MNPVWLNSVATQDGSEIEVRKNKSSKSAPKSGQKEFVYFRYYLEVDGNDLNQQIALISKLLETFWSQGIAAVAACEYEELLPEKGGINASHCWTHHN